MENPSSKEKKKIRDKRYIEKHKEIISQRAKVYYQKNKTKRNEYNKNYRLKNKMLLNKKANEYVGSAVKALGCSIEEFKMYIEAKFQIGMTWTNHGNNGWHIDHIKPLTAFDLTNKEQFLIACNYTNLQPLWAKDNFKKSNKYGN